MPDVVGLYFVGNRGARTNQRHFAFEHIDKLRQFVKTGSPQEATDAGDSSVLRQFINAVAIAIGWLTLGAAGDQFLDELFMNRGVVIDLHGSEFEKNKLLAVLPDSLLPEEHRAFRRQFDCDCNGEEKWREEQQCERAAGDIHNSFDRAEKLLRIIAALQIRIKRRIAWPFRNIVIPLFGK